MAARGSEAWMYQHWGQPGPTGNTTYELVPGVRITTRAEAKAAFQRLGAICQKHGYTIHSEQTGAYNKRKIRGSSRWSNHSWGTALDINWNSNPMTWRLTTDMPPAMVAEIKAIRTVDGITVFRWGGDYAHKKDAMHFEVMATPAELACGLAGANPQQGSPQTDTKNIEEDDVKKGDKGAAVKQVQRLVNGVIARSTKNGWADDKVTTITLDGVYGPATCQAVAHAMGRAQTIVGIDLADDWTPEVVTPAMTALLVQAVTQLGKKES